MSVETLQNIDLIEKSTQEELFQLKSQVEKPQNNKKKFEYLNKSKNKDYDVYRYKLYTPGIKLSKQAVIKYLEDEMHKQFGGYPEGCQFTDANGKEITKDWFENGDYVYLRIPQFRLEKTFSDKEKRNWKVYSYSLKGGEDYEKLEGIYQNMNEKIYTNLLPNRNFCDENGNPIKNVKLKKGEKVYIRIPDRDKVDSVPKMTMNDINKLSNEQIKHIFDSYQEYYDSGSKYEHADRKGDYIMINGKKLYIMHKYINYDSELKQMEPYLFVQKEEDGSIDFVLIGRRDGENFNGAECRVSKAEFDKTKKEYKFEYKVERDNKKFENNWK